MNARSDLRPVSINGHQEFWTGYFHRFVEHNGEAKAIIEDQQGIVKLVDAYMVKFMSEQELSEDGAPEVPWLRG